jgi:di/tricarboxylate transporter
VIEGREREEKNSGRMIRFIRRERRDYIFFFFVLLFFFSPLSTVDATRRASKRAYVCEVIQHRICAFKKQSKEQKNKVSLSLSTTTKEEEEEKKRKNCMFVILHI